ncbi:hypothetical protein BJ508DRAFT_313345 [Ascobolus immersus RN42]|uniref:Uncharacterized protein n=1 Tax=Ascobolus immersus RN42 TaxID=1160509 RepID=A0A3N4HLW3_ASCIM|nr:hypothetical protein BJ508DRAFT_313345 [Ascobolus immersus RN42]
MGRGLAPRAGFLVFGEEIIKEEQNAWECVNDTEYLHARETNGASWVERVVVEAGVIVEMSVYITTRDPRYKKTTISIPRRIRTTLKRRDVQPGQVFSDGIPIRDILVSHRATLDNLARIRSCGTIEYTNDPPSEPSPPATAASSPSPAPPQSALSRSSPVPIHRSRGRGGYRGARSRTFSIRPPTHGSVAAAVRMRATLAHLSSLPPSEAVLPSSPLLEPTISLPIPASVAGAAPGLSVEPSIATTNTNPACYSHLDSTSSAPGEDDEVTAPLPNASALVTVAKPQAPPPAFPPPTSDISQPLFRHSQKPASPEYNPAALSALPSDAEPSLPCSALLSSDQSATIPNPNTRVSKKRKLETSVDQGQSDRKVIVELTRQLEVEKARRIAAEAKVVVMEGRWRALAEESARSQVALVESVALVSRLINRPTAFQEWPTWEELDNHVQDDSVVTKDTDVEDMEEK